MIQLNSYENRQYDDDQGLPVRKQKPAHFHDVRQLPQTSLIFIAMDKTSLRIFHQFHQPCLFCPYDPASYDWGICYQREVWVLYADKNQFMSAMQLAYTVQRSGAAHVCAILVDRGLMRGCVNA